MIKGSSSHESNQRYRRMMSGDRNASLTSLYSRDDMDFNDFKEFIDDVYIQLQSINDGHVANYIPQLAEVNPELFAISACDVHGNLHSVGDSEILFCLQSTSKPFLYCTAQTLVGVDEVHRHIGHEPSGQRFNAFVLDEHNLPHNPMINAGAIMSCSMILAEEEPANRYKRVHNDLVDMCGNLGGVHFDNGVYLSEKEHASRNRALAFYMHEHNAFPTGTDIERTIELYFQACSITMATKTLSVAAGTLANGGVCPVTQKRVYSTDVVRNCVSLMYTCGMYDYSGRFAFEMGFPAKSGVSGAVLIVIPNILGIVVWSPRLDNLGNSVRGVEFCRRLIKRFPSLHLFRGPQVKLSGAQTSGDRDVAQQAFISAASRGDLTEVEKFIRAGDVDVNKGDYDGRTALHLACAEGHDDVVAYLMRNGADMQQKDRWGSTATHEVEKRIQYASEGSNSFDDSVPFGH